MNSTLKSAQKDRLKAAIDSGKSSVENLIQKTQILDKGKIRVKIKPLSVNEAWKGRRFKSKAYANYWKVLFFELLPPKIEMPEPPFQVHFKWGFSSLSSDWDNPIKPLQDILAEKYMFNDKSIKRGIAEVEDVKKGEEFFEFEITHLVRQ